MICTFHEFVFFFNDTATTEIYTLSLHDALPICYTLPVNTTLYVAGSTLTGWTDGDRKSTRLNSSHQIISYAVFCLKKTNTSAPRPPASSPPHPPPPPPPPHPPP